MPVSVCQRIWLASKKCAFMDVGGQAGVCVEYKAADSVQPRSLCNGAKPKFGDWPQVFENSYRRMFQPGLPAQHAISVRDKASGLLTVTPSAELEIAAAWDKTLSLMTLSTVTVFAVCLCVYLSISRALRPAKVMVAGLAKMAADNSAYRLPAFELNEWRQISAAINHLTASQQQLLAERQQLAAKLINLQEEERRYISQELHDEFGQCLAAINAVAASIEYTAAQQLPELVAEAQQISRIAEHMLIGVRDLLHRLRPAEFDALGLAASLQSLVSGWNANNGSKTRYQLAISGSCDALPEPQAVALLRIVQECLTNIAKHAAATSVAIKLCINDKSVCLSIVDDGIAAQLPFAVSEGIGL